MKSIFAFLRRKPNVSSRSASAAPQHSGQSSAPKSAAAKWLSKDDPLNPFVFDGYDCLAFVRSMLSTTKDAAVAASFVSLRTANRQEIRGTLPQEAVESTCRLEYAFGGELKDGAKRKASVMEEKWDIYLYGNRFYFCRSWTGALTLVAEAIVAGSTLSILRIGHLLRSSQPWQLSRLTTSSRAICTE